MARSALGKRNLVGKSGAVRSQQEKSSRELMRPHINLKLKQMSRLSAGNHRKRCPITPVVG